jgi:hypothetical protein
VTQQNFVSFLEFCGIGQAVVADLYPVNGHIQMFAGVVMDVMSPIFEVHRVVGHRAFLVVGGPEQ